MSVLMDSMAADAFCIIADEGFTRAEEVNVLSERTHLSVWGQIQLLVVIVICTTSGVWILTWVFPCQNPTFTTSLSR